MLKKAFRRAEETQADIVIYRANWYGEHSGIFEERLHVNSPKILPQKDVFSAREIESNPFLAVVGWSWDKLFRKNFIDTQKLWFQEIKIYNDMYFTYSAFLLAERITCIYEVLVHQRIQRTGSISRSISGNWVYLLEALSKLKERLISSEIYTVFEIPFINYALHMCLYTLDRTEGQSFVSMYTALRNNWFHSFQIENYSKEHFSSSQEYDRYQEICCTPVTDLLLKQIDRLEKGNAAAKYLADMKVRLSKAEKEIEEIKGSYSFRIGRAITWLPRKIRGGIRCCREHGLRYTWNRLIEKIQNKLRG